MTLDPEKYARNITLHCPTCAGTHFESEPGNPIHTCVGCRRVISSEDLKRENSEHIQAHVDEVKGQIAKDFKKHLQNAFRGNKFIKIK